jgi:hypothetical protein
MSFHLRSSTRPTLAAGALCLALLSSASASAHDYPTYERVQYAIQCISKYGGAQQLLYQCSCAIDKLAAQFSIDDFVDMQTAVNASSITGERGGEFRDNPEVRSAAKRYRESERMALKTCGVALP